LSERKARALTESRFRRLAKAFRQEPVVFAYLGKGVHKGVQEGDDLWLRLMCGEETPKPASSEFPLFETVWALEAEEAKLITLQFKPGTHTLGHGR
jgi:hypothetical protein